MANSYLDKTGLTYLWSKITAAFQAKLVSGTNIKTINNESILGSGDITISGGGSISPATSSELGGVLSGGDISVDANGNVSVLEADNLPITVNATSGVVTRSSGATIQSQHFVKYGRFGMLVLGLKYTSSVSSGSNFFVGTVAAAYRPAMRATGCEYYGNTSIIGAIETGGSITIRNASNAARTASDTFYVTFVYLTAS